MDCIEPLCQIGLAFLKNRPGEYGERVVAAIAVAEFWLVCPGSDSLRRSAVRADKSTGIADFAEVGYDGLFRGKLFLKIYECHAYKINSLSESKKTELSL